MNVGTQTATCVQPGGQIRLCTTSGCGRMFFQNPPTTHNNSSTNRVCTRSTACGNVFGSSSGWHYMFRTTSLARKVSEPYGQYNSGGTHEGIDITHATQSVNNMPVYSVGNGTVRFAGWNGGGYGNLVRLNIGNNVILYAHLGNNTIVVRSPNPVTVSDMLGRVSDTESPNNFHLHFEVRNSNDAKNGVLPGFDPRNWYPNTNLFTY